MDIYRVKKYKIHSEFPNKKYYMEFTNFYHSNQNIQIKKCRYSDQ